MVTPLGKCPSTWRIVEESVPSLMSCPPDRCRAADDAADGIAPASTRHIGRGVALSTAPGLLAADSDARQLNRSASAPFSSGTALSRSTPDVRSGAEVKHDMIRVVVAGAGIGGLTLGIALARAGVAVDLYERADELREVGAAVALSANGTRLLYRLGVGEELDAVSTQPSELIYRDGRSGERIAAHPGAAAYRARFGAPYWGVHRVDLQQTLATAFTDAAGAGHLHLGHAVTAVDAEAGTLTLDDGTVVGGDVVVGADGVHSTVRDAVAGPGTGPVYSGTSAFRGLVPVDALPGLPDPHAIQFWAGPDAHLLHYALGRDDDTVNFFAVLCGPATWEGGNRPAAEDELLDGFAGWHPAVREMLAAVPQSPRWPLLSQPSLTRWTRGRTVLIGDAVHAMLPHHG